jgi:splicing factor 3B subunit 3
MAAFRDKLLVGVGTSLRLYDLGKKQLLRKAEARMVVANKICALAVAGGDRIFVGDVQDSVTLFKYYPPSSAADGAVSVAAAGPIATGRESGRFVPVARDGVSRYIVTLLSLDYSTVCGSDKFGNVFVLRVPPELSGAEVAGGRSGPQRNSALHPLAVEACFHVGSTVTSLARGTLRGGSGVETRVGSSSNDDGESIIYSTMGGAIGVLTPFTVKSDADLAIEMEKELRLRYDSLAGRSHVSYRSSFAPVRHVIDGDLCEMFVGLSRDAQLASAVRLERDLPDVLRKLDEFRANVV